MIKKMWARVKTWWKRKLKSLNARRKTYMAPRPHRSFKRTKSRRTPLKIATLRQTVFGSLRTIFENKKLLFGLGLIYMVATYIFVGGIAQTDFVALKQATSELFGGSFSSAGTVFSLLTSTMTGAFNSNMTELQQFLAVFIGFMFWLTLIWALRMRFAGQTIKIRDALYNSGAPIIPYVLVILVIILQLSPGGIGVFVLATAQAGGFLQGGVEVMMFALAAVLLGILSVYWISGSLVSLVIITLPNMYPWRALSIASELVIGRRLRVILHLLVLGLVLLLMWVVVLFPTLLIDSWLRWDWLPLIPIVVQILGAFTIIYAATYVYRLYRSLL